MDHLNQNRIDYHSHNPTNQSYETPGHSLHQGGAGLPFHPHPGEQSDNDNQAQFNNAGTHYHGQVSRNFSDSGVENGMSSDILRSPAAVGPLGPQLQPAFVYDGSFIQYTDQHRRPSDTQQVSSYAPMNSGSNPTGPYGSPAFDGRSQPPSTPHYQPSPGQALAQSISPVASCSVSPLDFRGQISPQQNGPFPLPETSNRPGISPLSPHVSEFPLEDGHGMSERWAQEQVQQAGLRATQ